jgi:ABC-2 type transport system permease protein
LRNIGIICRKELGSYLTSPMAYIVTAIFLALSGTFFTSYLAGTNYMDTSIRGFLNAAQILILLFAAVLTMRLVSEERKLGTWEFLLTSPLRDSEIVIGKFLGSLGVLVGMLVLTLYYPILLAIFGDPDLGPIATSYLGLVLLGSACLSVGIFASTLSSNQIVSAVVAGGILFGLWFLGSAASFAPGGLGEVLSYLSLSHHFPDFIRGIVDTQAIVYYLTVTGLFLYFAIGSIETGRWG